MPHVWQNARLLESFGLCVIFTSLFLEIVYKCLLFYLVKFEPKLEMLIRVIKFDCILDTCHGGSHLCQGQLVVFQLKINYSSYQVCTGLLLVKLRVKCQSISGCHQLIIGSTLPSTNWVQTLFSRIRLSYCYSS